MSRMTADEALRWANRAIERCTTDADVFAALLRDMRRMHEEIRQLREENEREVERGNDLARQLNAAEGILSRLRATLGGPS